MYRLTRNIPRRSHSSQGSQDVVLNRIFHAIGETNQQYVELGFNAPSSTATNLNVFEPDVDTTTTTDPLDADSDDDGIQDGIEDSNHNGRTDTLETNPLNVDSDGDGIQDGTEMGIRIPLTADTDINIFSCRFTFHEILILFDYFEINFNWIGRLRNATVN